MITTKIWTYALILLTLSCLLHTSCKDNVEKTKITVTGVAFSPNFFMSEGEIEGIDVDISKAALLSTGVEMDISLSESWTDAYNATLNGSKRALLTVGFSAERKDLFKWAGPTSQGMYGIFTKNDGVSLYPLSIEKSKELESIAVVRDWLETTTLEDLGFENLVYFNTYSEALAAFMNDDVKFISSDFYHLIMHVQSGQYRNIQTVTRYRTVFYYIAFSKDVDDIIVEKCQQQIETMIKNQSTLAIVRKYFPTMPADYIAGTIQIFTEDAPPYQYNTGVSYDRKVEGSSVEILNEIQSRTGFVNKINLSTWTDAYTQPQYLPNSAVFTAARTPEREHWFQWVGPISSNKTYFYTLANSGITIETLEQAKALQSIATPKNWYTHDFLTNNNFQNIVATSITSLEAFNQLINGEVQALLLTDVDVKWLADNNDVAMSELTQNMIALNYNGYIAFSLNTPASLVQEWQAKLDEMKTDGTFTTIWNKWFDGVTLP